MTNSVSHEGATEESTALKVIALLSSASMSLFALRQQLRKNLNTVYAPHKYLNSISLTYLTQIVRPCDCFDKLQKGECLGKCKCPSTFINLCIYLLFLYTFIHGIKYTLYINEAEVLVGSCLES